MILELLKNDGLESKRKTATEYSSSCPACGGRDRFMSWPESDKWWCRQCEKSGDSIQYLRDFHGLSYQEAAGQVGKVVPAKPIRRKIVKKKIDHPDWSASAEKLVGYANYNLISDKNKLAWLKDERGISVESVRKHKLGWLNQDYYRKRKQWGLEGDKKLFIPSGLVIPSIDKGKTIRVRIRRDKQGEYSKYHVLQGSSSAPMVIKRAEVAPVIIVESELDAILLSQELRNPFTIISMGSAQIKPDEKLATELKSVPFIFICLDSDSAGAKQAHGFWLSEFDNAVRVPIPKKYGKDPTEAQMNGLDLNMVVAVGYEFVIEMGEL